MSKERLEEIVEKISEQTFDRIIVPQTKITIEYQDIKYLFNTIEEQVEQNKRYEEELERRNGVHQENIYRMGEEMKAVEKINKLEEQNKLYRQLLEEVIEEGSCLMIDRISDVLYSDDHNDRMSK